MNKKSFKDYLKTPFALSYGPKYLITEDGGSICYACAKENKNIILDAIKEDNDPQWMPIASGINWEDDSLCCDHCNNIIYPEYD